MFPPVSVIAPFDPDVFLVPPLRVDFSPKILKAQTVELFSGQDKQIYGRSETPEGVIGARFTLAAR
jgi:hypothetical protein